MRNAFLMMTGFVLFTSLACSSDKGTGSNGPDGGGGGGDGGGGNSETLPDGGCPSPKIPDAMGHCLAPADATSMCEQTSASQSPAGTKVDDTSCGAGCTCTYCAAEMFQCGTDPDCVKILICAQSNNCTGADCYTPDKCMDIIDAADNGQGLAGNGVALAQLVNACVTKTMIGTMDYSTRGGPTCMAGCQ